MNLSHLPLYTSVSFFRFATPVFSIPCLFYLSDVKIPILVLLILALFILSSHSTALYDD